MRGKCVREEVGEADTANIEGHDKGFVLDPKRGAFQKIFLSRE